MNRRLLFLLIGLWAVKAIFLALDSEPSFHFRESAVYLATAIGKWIPPDHSFVYGLLLRPVALWPRSLAPILIMQAALSGIASWLIGVCLVRYFATGFMVAALCSFACAIEPLQLRAERYVLTESVATFVFAVFLVAIFSYLKTSSLSLLALIQILAVLLVTLRVNFVPAAWIASFFIPLASRRAISFWRSSRQSIRRGTGQVKWISAVRFVVLPLLFSILLSQSLLFGYRRLYSELLRQPAAYPNRASVPVSAEVAPRNFFDLLKRAGFRYAEYFDADRLRRSLQLDEGQFVDALPGETQAIKVAFGIDVTKQSSTSLTGLRSAPLTKRWQERSVMWCWFVILLPLFYLLYLAMNWRRIRVPHIIVGLCGLILLLEGVMPVESPNPRYLTTLAWLDFLMIGSAGTGLLKRGASS
ncbi:MAG: hypothetical protein ACR2JB_18215 [Bryobacteraceae bacterium]